MLTIHNETLALPTDSAATWKLFAQMYVFTLYWRANIYYHTVHARINITETTYTLATLDITKNKSFKRLQI